MKTTITARFCRCCPLSDFDKGFTVFDTLLFQYLQKLLEGVIRDFASPEAFHTVKVQRFKTEYIKLYAKFSSKFPLPICSLSSNFSVVSCQRTTRMIPIVRTFDLRQTRNLAITLQLSVSNKILSLYNIFMLMSSLIKTMRR